MLRTKDIATTITTIATAANITTIATTATIGKAISKRVSDQVVL